MIAVDTNVLLYLDDRDDPVRQAKAIALLQRESDGVLLWQVCCEFIAASRKLNDRGFTASAAWECLHDLLALYPLQLPSANALGHARTFHQKFGIAFWDAMIIGASVDAGVECLFTEDVPAAGHSLPLRIENPFA